MASEKLRSFRLAKVRLGPWTPRKRLLIGVISVAVILVMVNACEIDRRYPPEPLVVAYINNQTIVMDRAGQRYAAGLRVEQGETVDAIAMSYDKEVLCLQIASVGESPYRMRYAVVDRLGNEIFECDSPELVHQELKLRHMRSIGRFRGTLFFWPWS
jgi:hypothetical protein